MPLLTDFLNPGNIYFRDKTYSPDVIRQNIDAVADCLNKRTVSNSPFVYLFAPNHIKTVYALYGIIQSGKICVLVDPAIGRLELAEMMADTVPGALIRIDKSTDAFEYDKEFEFRQCALEEKKLEGLEDVCLILYTNASDGYAKGAMLTNESLRANAETIVKGKGVTKDSVSCSPIDFHHLFALQTSVIASFLAGGSVLLSEVIAPGRIRGLVDEMEKYKATHFYAVPIVFYLLAKIPDLSKRIANVKIFVSGGYKLSHTIYERFYKKSGKNILEGYGLTETSLAITWHKPGEPVKIDSVGKPFPCCEIRVFGLKNEEVVSGYAGEICVRGLTIMKGYYNNEIATKRVIIDGWFHTDDIGYMDSEGFVYLTGNKKRMVNIGGNKVYPAEVERLMKQHSNVVSAEVSGEIDGILLSKLKAKVKLKINRNSAQEEFGKWLKGNVAQEKIVEDIKFT